MTSTTLESTTPATNFFAISSKIMQKSTTSLFTDECSHCLDESNNSSWGELELDVELDLSDLMKMNNKQDHPSQRTLSTRASTTTSKWAEGSLAGMDDSSWGTLELEESMRLMDSSSCLSTRFNDSSSCIGRSMSTTTSASSLEEPDFTRRRRATYGGGNGGLLDASDISCPRRRRGGRRPRRRHSTATGDDHDEDDDVNELANCLKSMYGDFSSSSNAASTSSHRRTALSSTTTKNKSSTTGKRKKTRRCRSFLTTATAPILKRTTTA